jgi:hypothetical protein
VLKQEFEYAFDSLLQTDAPLNGENPTSASAEKSSLFGNSKLAIKVLIALPGSAAALFDGIVIVEAFRRLAIAPIVGVRDFTLGSLHAALAITASLLVAPLA